MNSDPPPDDIATATAGGYNPCSCCSSLPSCSCDFLFAYNNSNLSDRVLHIEIVDSSSSSSSSSVDSSNCDSTADRPEKRTRLDNQNDTAGQSPEGTRNNDPNPSEVPSRVETIHINSAILAARSLFFQKLFLNGIMESRQKHVTLRINSSEEAAVTELLKFMYGKSLSSTSARDVLDILMVADKYEVSSCKWCCCKLLQNLPMSLESALLYLKLPSSLPKTKQIMDLTKLAKQFLVDRYKDMTKLNTEMMELPLVGIEAVLSSDDLQAMSEDKIYDFVVKWAQTHYQNQEERRDILATRLIGLVRFPCMSPYKLKMILKCNDIDRELLTKLVLDALFFKAETAHRRSILALEQANTIDRGFVERNYALRPIRAVELLLPKPHCVVYFDLKREECVNLFPSRWLRSRPFSLAGQAFFLSAGCSKHQLTSTVSFGVAIGMDKMGLTSVQVDYRFSARSKLTDDYALKTKSTVILTGGGRTIGQLNLFNMPWGAFIQEESEYFINNMLHIRAEVSITG